jgi:hypothetical protein
MSPEEKAQLRHLIRKAQQLPQPKSELFKRVSKGRAILPPFRKIMEPKTTIRQQAAKQMREKKPDN